MESSGWECDPQPRASAQAASSALNDSSDRRNVLTLASKASCASTFDTWPTPSITGRAKTHGCLPASPRQHYRQGISARNAEIKRPRLAYERSALKAS